MKLIEFYLITKDNTTVYDTVEYYTRKSTRAKIVPIEEIIEKDFVAELRVEYSNEGVLYDLMIMSYDVESLMNWVKEHYPDLYKLIPGFRVDMFQYIADEMESSSSLSYTAIDPDFDLRDVVFSDLDTDDFVPERKTVEESCKEITQNGFYTEIHCYPNSPVGFWNYYGLDFQSLLDHVVKD